MKFMVCSSPISATRYIVVNEARSGSSWLQEISMMHPGIRVQFELDMEYGPSALACKQCHRPKNPDSKFPERLPPKTHPPQACGMTIFGGNNKVEEVRTLAGQHNASLVITKAASAWKFAPTATRSSPANSAW